MEPTVYVEMKGQPIVTDTLRTLMKAFGGNPVKELVDGQDVEADFAIVNSTEDGLRALKETERTIIFVMSLGHDQRTETSAFAARFPKRVRHWPAVEAAGEENVIFAIKRAIEEMAKEKNS